MGLRGPKSAAALTVHPGGLQRRPDPPECLTEQQKATWIAVALTKPPDWFAADSFPLLVAYCKAIEAYGVVSAQIDAFDPEWLTTVEGLKRYDTLTIVREREARTLAMLATRMRLSQQSRMTERKAATADKAAGSGRKPWESAKAVN